MCRLLVKSMEAGALLLSHPCLCSTCSRCNGREIKLHMLMSLASLFTRYGFNSSGHEIVKQNLEQCQMKDYQGILGINLGKNKTSEDPVLDYTKGVEIFGPMCDYLVINVSSPNTPGLRAMQGREMLASLIDKVQ